MAGFVPQAQLGVVVLTNIASLPLRDILLYEGIDRALDLAPQDWNSKYHKVFDPIIVAQKKSKQSTADDRLDAPPSHALETYTGTYSADGYPDFKVSLNDSAMQASLAGVFEPSEFRHYHYNVFEWHWADFDEWVKVRFIVNNNGNLASVAIPIESAVDNVIYTRKALELPADTQAAIIRRYDTDIEGLSYIISERQDKLYLTQTGGTAQELKAYDLNEKFVAFKMGQNRAEFVRDGESVTGLVVKTPFSTFEAQRVS